MRALPWFALALTACAVDATDDATDELSLDERIDAVPVAKNCPDLSTPGIKTFTSGGEERRVGIWFPESKPEGMPIMFAFHGLTSPGAFDVIDDYMRPVFDLDTLADKREVVIVAPEAAEFSLFGFPTLLWGIMEEDGLQRDLTLFDDLRSCMAHELRADPDNTAAWGFSGGGLWTSMLLLERADVLVTAVPASGGVGEVGLLTDYRSPKAKIPVMLVDGGPDDIWPGGGVALIEFHEGTNLLREELVDDGHDVVQCDHGLGHDLPGDFWDGMKRWMFSVYAGDADPFVGTKRLLKSECTDYR